MPKVTTPGITEPKDWLTRLALTLEKRSEIYNRESDPSLRRNKAIAMYHRVVLALHELPPFSDVRLLVGLKDLLIFLVDIDNGKDHEWLQTKERGAGNSTRASEVERNTWVRAAYVVLLSNEYGKGEASARIAQGLSASGRRMGGRDSRPIPPRRVAVWCREPSKRPDAQRFIDDLIQRWWNEYLQAALDGDLPELNGLSRKALAGRFVDILWTLHPLRDLSVSAQSKQT